MRALGFKLAELIGQIREGIGASRCGHCASKFVAADFADQGLTSLILEANWRVHVRDRLLPASREFPAPISALSDRGWESLRSQPAQGRPSWERQCPARLEHVSQRQHRDEQKLDSPRRLQCPELSRERHRDRGFALHAATE